MQETERLLKALEQVLHATPWALTDNFLTAVDEGKAALQIADLAGDPTGQGRGYSYLRQERKVGLEYAQHALQADEAAFNDHAAA